MRAGTWPVSGVNSILMGCWSTGTTSGSRAREPRARQLIELARVQKAGGRRADGRRWVDHDEVVVETLYLLPSEGPAARAVALVYKGMDGAAVVRANPGGFEFAGEDEAGFARETAVGDLDVTEGRGDGAESGGLPSPGVSAER